MVPCGMASLKIVQHVHVGLRPILHYNTASQFTLSLSKPIGPTMYVLCVNKSKLRPVYRELSVTVLMLVLQYFRNLYCIVLYL